MSRPRRHASRKSNSTRRDSATLEERSAFDLPLDVVIEVSQYLEPVDILHLTRTTKHLRAFLLDRQRSRHLWKTAFGNVPDLPPCPDHLSEPAYAHLAFVPECHGCCRHCDIILWELRMRCCKECLPKVTVSSPELPPDEISLTTVAVYFLPHTTVHLKLDERDLRIDGVEMTPRHRSLDWENFWTRVQNDKRCIESLAGKEHMRWHPVTGHAELCRLWEEEQLNAQRSRLRLVRQERADEIRKNLEALGWTDGIYYSTCFLRLPAVGKSEPLTSAEWSEISQQVVASLPNVRLAQIAENYRRRLQTFQNVLDYTFVELDVVPFAADLSLLLPIRDVLENDIDPEMDSLALQELRRIIPELVRQWDRDAVDELASFAQRQLGPEADVDSCNIIFTCMECQRDSNRSHPHIDFDSVLSHEHVCWRNTAEIEENDAIYGNMSESEIYEKVVETYEQRRSLEVLQVNKKASKDMDRLAKALGCRVFIRPAS